MVSYGYDFEISGLTSTSREQYLVVTAVQVQLQNGDDGGTGSSDTCQYGWVLHLASLLTTKAFAKTSPQAFMLVYRQPPLTSLLSKPRLTIRSLQEYSCSHICIALVIV